MSLYASKARAATQSEAEGASRSRDCPPANFDAGAHPIIACHFFGIGPLHPIGAVAMVADFRFRRQVEHLHRLGPRAVAELLREVAKSEDLDRALEPYQRLTPGC